MENQTLFDCDDNDNDDDEFSWFLQGVTTLLTTVCVS